MSDVREPNLPRWPFYLGDVLLLGLAYLIYQKHATALGHWELALAVLCVIVGGVFAVTPFVLEYRAALKRTEARDLTSVVAQLQNLEGLTAQITHATGHWQDAHKHADKTAGAAREIAERMAGELRTFSEFMQRANEGEKGTLRLEVEKLRRAEGDWLQIVVRILDHTFALHRGAVRSGRETVIAQVTNFQSVCLDAARRVGLTMLGANTGEPFDPQKHQSIEDGVKPPPDATITETVAPGYSFQGKLIRPVLVRHAGMPQTFTPEEPADQSQLPLEQTDAPQ